MVIAHSNRGIDQIEIYLPDTVLTNEGKFNFKAKRSHKWANNSRDAYL